MDEHFSDRQSQSPPAPSRSATLAERSVKARRPSAPRGTGAGRHARSRRRRRVEDAPHRMGPAAMRKAARKRRRSARSRFWPVSSERSPISQLAIDRSGNGQFPRRCPRIDHSGSSGALSRTREASAGRISSAAGRSGAPQRLTRGARAQGAAPHSTRCPVRLFPEMRESRATGRDHARD